MSLRATPAQNEVQTIPQPAGFVSPKSVALLGVLTALTTAVTMAIAIPFPPTRGYFNLGEAVVFFTALSFGWKAGGICGGIGSAAADILLGYGVFAVITLIAKGTEGLVCGAISRAGNGRRWAMVLGIAAGGACMITGYFLGEWVYLGLGPAILELFTVNIAQAAIGGSIGLALFYAVSRFLKARGSNVGQI